MAGMRLLDPGDLRKESIYPDDFHPLTMQPFCDISIGDEVERCQWEETCYIDKVNKVILFPPVMTHLDDSVNPRPSFEALLNGLRQLQPDINLDDYHLLGGLVGTGNSEQHIVTLHRKPQGETTVYDSKCSDAATLLAHSYKPALTIKDLFSNTRQFCRGAYRVVKGFFRSLLTWNHGFNIDSTIEGGQAKPLRYEYLGTQSFFDGGTCGYHSLGLSHLIYGLIKSKETVDRQSVMRAIKKQNPLSIALDYLDKKHGKKSRTRKSFIALMQEAWKETFQSSYSKTGLRYIFDWPSQNENGYWYVLSARWLRAPIKAVVKSLVEWPIKLVSVLFNWLRHRLLFWTPVASYTKATRSALLFVSQFAYSLVQLVGVILGKILSPLAKEGRLDYSEAEEVEKHTGVMAFDGDEVFDDIPREDSATLMIKGLGDVEPNPLASSEDLSSYGSVFHQDREVVDDDDQLVASLSSDKTM